MRNAARLGERCKFAGRLLPGHSGTSREIRPSAMRLVPIAAVKNALISRADQSIVAATQALILGIAMNQKHLTASTIVQELVKEETQS